VSLPTYFVSRSNEPAAPLTTDPDTAIHALDNFFTAHGEDLVEWVVLAMGDERLHAVRLKQRSALPSHIQTELAFNEVARAASARVLDIAEFYLFDLKLAEQASDEPGPNDPVYLYGVLCGPYGAEIQTEPTSVEGQLTLTRADFLEGVIRGVNHGYRYANPAGAGSRARPSLCFHMMLPLDREEQIQKGRGAAIAYPLIPSELLTANPANEIVVNQLVFDMLTAMKNDVTKGNEQNPLRTQLLPVPSRPMLEQELVKQGFRIEGDSAVKTPQATGMVGELLLAVFGEYVQKKVKLPPEGTITQFADIAQKTLTALAGWPTRRSIALQARMKPPWGQAQPVPKTAIPISVPPAAPRVQHSPPASVRPSPAPPPPPIPLSPAPPPRPNIYKPRSRGTPDWMKDFVDAHRKPGRAAPKLTRVEEIQPRRDEELKKPRKVSPRKPDWMKDFE
jgi:hypothetical protein